MTETAAAHDVIVIGGGPGGSITGAALAQAGKKVLILERETFPRFHVGESLIPFGNDVLKKIGVWDKLLAAGFMKKLGAEFVLGNAQARIQVLFGRYLGEAYAQTFQVERSKFDHLLLDNAITQGCEVWQQAKVQQANIQEDHVTVTCQYQGETRELRARWVVDASGRDAFLGKQLGLEKTDLGMPKKFATFAHFHNVKRNDPPADGHITVVRLGFGWFWIIPLDAEKTSVGLVQTAEHFKSTGLTPAECFEHVVATTPEMQARLGNAKRVCDFNFAGDYTYRHLRNAGDRWLLVGDAAGFIDPIFSSGVMLSIKSGYLAAQNIIKADSQKRVLSASEQAAYTKKVGEMCGIFLSMIKMFYDNHSFEVFMTPKPPKGMEWAVNNLVAGNTNLGWKLRLQVWLFYIVCWLQHYVAMVPRLSLGRSTALEKS